jgi:SAM-dependent methyltransferase
MSVGGAELSRWESLTAEQRSRWTTVLDHLIAAMPSDDGLVVVDGADGRAGMLADRLADRLRKRGRSGVDVVADSARTSDLDLQVAWHLTVWVRTPAAAGGNRGDHADAIVDLHEPTWPVLRHIDPWLIPHDHWYRTESRAFFATRASTWDARFGADLPAYATAVVEAGLASGGVAVDVGCGTGRALPALREAVGAAGTVIGVDHTPQMLTAALERARLCDARLILADARCLPLSDGAVDAVFAAGLVQHLPDHEAGLAELARVTRSGGRLVIFHPSGRAALAARHGRTLRPDEPLAEAVLREYAARSGWRLTGYDDPPHRFHAVAVRR